MRAGAVGAPRGRERAPTERSPVVAWPLATPLQSEMVVQYATRALEQVVGALLLLLEPEVRETIALIRVESGSPCSVTPRQEAWRRGSTASCVGRRRAAASRGSTYRHQEPAWRKGRLAEVRGVELVAEEQLVHAPKSAQSELCREHADRHVRVREK